MCGQQISTGHVPHWDLGEGDQGKQRGGCGELSPKEQWEWVFPLKCGDVWMGKVEETSPFEILTTYSCSPCLV